MSSMLHLPHRIKYQISHLQSTRKGEVTNGKQNNSLMVVHYNVHCVLAMRFRGVSSLRKALVGMVINH